MGRVTEFFDYINYKEILSDKEISNRYFSLTITKEIKKLKEKYLSRLSVDASIEVAQGCATARRPGWYLLARRS